MYRTSINMYMHVFVFLWIFVLYSETGMTTSSEEYPRGVKAILRCAPPNVYHRLIQHIQNGTFTGITNLDMSSCYIKNLAPGTFNFEAFIKIKILQLNHNQISRLQSDIFHVSAFLTLETLYLDCNQISYLSPKQFVYLHKLQFLGLSHNQLKNIQPGIFATNPLATLRLSFNYLEKLPGNLFAGNISSTLKILHLRRNRLKVINNCLFKSNTNEGIFPNLEILDLSRNNIKVQHNQITFLPEELFDSPYLKNVIVIKLSNNRIKSIPENFFKHLTSLEYIDLRNNKIKHFSQIMLPKRLHQFCELYLSHNEITSTGELVRTVLRKSQFLISKQQTNCFPLSTEPKQDRIQIQGTLDLSNNKISKFEVATCETVPLFSIKVFRKRDWLHTQGNKVFSVINLVKAASHIDLNYIKL